MRSGHVVIRLPGYFGFKHQGAVDFQPALEILDWDLRDTNVIIDLSACARADFQALSLLILYLWHLRSQGCFVTVEDGTSEPSRDVGAMWRKMGAQGWDRVLWDVGQQFRSNEFKPLIAIRGKKDFDCLASAPTRRGSTLNTKRHCTTLCPSCSTTQWSTAGGNSKPGNKTKFFRA
jgi:hypothetical protein